MNASKSMQLLAVAHNYQEQDKKVLIFYPATDTRGDVDTVSSRIGITNLQYELMIRLILYQ